MTAAENWTPRPDSVPARAIKWLGEHGKTGHRVLSESIDAERISMTSLLKRSIEAGLIIQTHEQGEYHYDVPAVANPPGPPQEDPPSAEDLARAKQNSANLLTAAMRNVVAVARFPAATMEEAFEEIGSATAAPTVYEAMASTAQHEQQVSPPNGAPVLREFITTTEVVYAARADIPEPSDDALETAAAATEPTIIEHETLNDFSCAIYSDGRFVMVLGQTTIVLQEEVADALREYVRKHWPHDVHMGIQAALRGSM